MRWLWAVMVSVIVSIVLVAVVVVSVRIATQNSARTGCANNLRQLGTRLVANHAQKPWPSWGAAWDLREDGVECLACPGDPRIDPQDEAWRRRVAALGPDPSTWPEGTTSYAFRERARYPLRAEDEPPHALACDLRLDHHGDGIHVLYEDGKVEFLERADPGPFRLGPDGPTAR